MTLWRPQYTYVFSECMVCGNMQYSFIAISSQTCPPVCQKTPEEAIYACDGFHQVDATKPDCFASISSLRVLFELKTSLDPYSALLKVLACKLRQSFDLHQWCCARPFTAQSTQHSRPPFNISIFMRHVNIYEL